MNVDAFTDKSQSQSQSQSLWLLSVNAPTFNILFGRVNYRYFTTYLVRGLVKYIEVLTFHFICVFGLCSRSQQLKIQRRRYTVYELSEQPSDWTLLRTRYCVDEKQRGDRGVGGGGGGVGKGGGGVGSVRSGEVHFRLILLPFSYRKAAALPYSSLWLSVMELTSLFVPKDQTSWQTLHSKTIFFSELVWRTKFQTPSWVNPLVWRVSCIQSWWTFEIWSGLSQTFTSNIAGIRHKRQLSLPHTLARIVGWLVHCV